MTGVAAFDFDGTLTRRDTFAPFLMAAAGRVRVARHLSAELAGARGRPDRDVVKLALLRRLFRGWELDRFDRMGAQYALGLPSRLRSDARERIGEHQARGHLVVLVSAGLGTYLRPFARELGVDHVIAVEMLAEDGRLTGLTHGANVRGPEKARLLQHYLAAEGLSDHEIWAYGNSSGDRDLLAMAHHPTWIKGRS